MTQSTEHAHQVGFLNWWNRMFPGLVIFSVPNGGKRDISTAKKLKAEGLTPGVPDLFCPALKLFVEMKTPTGKLSPAQKSMIKYLNGVGYTVIVGYGAEDASRQVLDYVNSNR